MAIAFHPRTQPFLIPVLMGFLLTSTAWAAQGRVIDYGIYAYSRDGGKTWIHPTSRDPVTSEHAFPVLIEKTTRIPAVKDVYFAYDYEITGLPEGVVHMQLQVKHPLMKKPDGTVATGYTQNSQFLVAKGQVHGFSGYILEHEWEHVPGTWTFSYHYEGKKLLEQKFEVFKP